MRKLLVATSVLLAGFFFWPSHRALRKAPILPLEPTAEMTAKPEENILPTPEETSPPEISRTRPPAPSLPAPPEASATPSEVPEPLRPDYTAEEFKRKFRSKPLAEWMRESKPYDFARGGVAPNSQEAYVLRGRRGEKIQYRQAMGLSAEGQNGDDCVSLKLPGQDPIVGFWGDGTLEVRETPVKWTFLIILQKKHYFIEHIDSSKWNIPVLHESAIYYYVRDGENKFHFQGELLDRDPEYPTAPDGGHLPGPAHCRAPFDGSLGSPAP